MSAAAERLVDWAARGRSVVHEFDTKTLLAEAGITVPCRDPVSGACVVKISSDAYPHKTEHGLIRIGIPATETAAVAAELAARVAGGVPLIEEMIGDGVAEWIVGCRHDATFGPVVVIGAGGILVELLDEAKVRLAPTDVATARRAIEAQRGARVLAGVRGKPAGDVDALTDLVARLSVFFATHAETIDEIEINPVIVRPAGCGVVAADALMKLKRPKTHQP